MHEYDLYLPLSFNDGRPIPPGTVEATKKHLVERFGGVTDFRHRNEGLWKVGSVTYRDEILILRVLASSRSEARQVFARLQDTLKTTLSQDEILVVERAVEVL